MLRAIFKLIADAGHGGNITGVSRVRFKLGSQTAYEDMQVLLLRNWHNHFDNYENYLPGYCGGISLGDWRNLNELLEEGINLRRYPILGFLINQDFGYQESKEGYVSKCHLCVDIRKHLLTKQKFEELKPKELDFYLE